MTGVRTRASIASEVLTGRDATAALQSIYAELGGASSAFTTQPSWLIAAATHLPGEAVVVAVREEGRIVACASFTRTRYLGITHIALLGSPFNDYAALWIADLRYAEPLADAIAKWVQVHRVWSLAMEQLPVADPVLAVLPGLLPHALVSDGRPMRRIQHLATDTIPSSKRRQVGKALGCLASSGQTALAVTVSPDASATVWLDQTIAVRCERDHSLGRRSLLDDERYSRFYRDVVSGALREKRAQLNVLLVDGRVAAYAVVFIDGAVHRMFDRCTAPGADRHRAEVALDIHAVDRALAAGATTFDWLRGVPEARFATDEASLAILSARSSWLVAPADRLFLTIKALMRPRAPGWWRSFVVRATDHSE